MRTQRLFKRSILHRRTLKAVVQSGKMFDRKFLAAVASRVAMRLFKSPEYDFMILLHDFHRRSANQEVTAQRLRAFRQSKRCCSYMKPQLFYAELVCLIEDSRIRLRQHPDLKGMMKKFTSIRKKLPKGLRRKSKDETELQSMPLRLVS